MIIVLVILLVEEEAPLVSFQSLEIRHSVGNQDQHQPRLSLTLCLDHLNQKYEVRLNIHIDICHPKTINSVGLYINKIWPFPSLYRQMKSTFLQV